MDAPTTLIWLFGFVREPVRALSIALNDVAIGALLSLALILALTWHYREQRMLPYLFCALALALILGFAFKTFLQEPRPCIAVPGKIPCPLDFSLPSLHALLAFTLVVVSLGNRSFPFYLLFALFVAFSRVYLGVHTISQVAAGLALAFFACVLCELLWKAKKWEVPRAVHIKHDSDRMRN